MKGRLGSIVSRFKKARILVVGDVMLDEFIWGTVSRISPEAPVPVVWAARDTFMPGGAGNVAANIASLGAEVYICGIIGEDEKGRILSAELAKRSIDVSGLVLDNHRPTTSKTRIIAHHQQVVRIDREKVDGIPKGLLDRMSEFIRSKINYIHALIIEDYGKGVVTSSLLRRIIPLAKRHNKILMVDPKEDRFTYYKGVTCITPNRQEAQLASGVKIIDKDSLKKAGQRLLKRLRCQTVLITLGEDGMCLFERDKDRPLHIPTLAQEVFDVSGAGDTVIAVFALALCSGASHKEAAQISNCAAGIVVGKVGIAVVTQDELQERLKQMEKAQWKR